MRNASFNSSVSDAPAYSRSRMGSVLSGLNSSPSMGPGAASQTAYGKAMAAQAKQAARSRMGDANMEMSLGSQKARSSDLQNMYQLYRDAEANYSRRRTAARQLAADQMMGQADINQIYRDIAPNLLSGVLSSLFG